jgi:hypothetical protein
MAITNYTNLQTTIADFLNRDDLTAVIPTFIQLAEAQINREIRHWKMETRASGQQSAGDEYMQIPADWLETIRFHCVDQGTSPIVMVSRDAMADLRAKNEDNSSKTTYYYTHADSQFQLYPTPKATLNVELLYYAKTPALSSTVASNWLLQDAPDVYLYGSLLHSAPYLAEDARVAVWAQMYSAAVQNVNSASEQARYSGSGMTLKVRGLG